MTARVEIVFNPSNAIPPLKTLTYGESYLLQTGEKEFTAIVSNELIYQELSRFITTMEALSRNPIARDDVRDLALSFCLKLNTFREQKEFERVTRILTNSRIKHEYRHLEQSLSFFRNEDGTYTDFLSIHKLHRAYRLGDKLGLMDENISDSFNYYSEYLQTLMELDAIIAESEEDHLCPGLASEEMILWRLSSVMKYMHLPDGLICDGFPHLKAMIVLLTRRIDLADKNEDSPVNYDEIVPEMVSSLRLGLENPQKFLNVIKKEVEPKVVPLLKDAYLLFMETHQMFLQDALEKNIIPDWR